MQTFTVIAHFTNDLNDPVSLDILSPDGTERVKESRSIDWSNESLFGVAQSVIEDRWLGYGPTFDNARRGTREKFATNHDSGQNFVLYEVLYDDPKRSAPVPSFDTKDGAWSLSDCLHWDRPEADCSGPRVGKTPDGVILCEGHFNKPPRP